MPVKSLSELCMRVIATKLELYPPDAIGQISQDEWESIVKLKSELSAPKQHRTTSTNTNQNNNTTATTNNNNNNNNNNVSMTNKGEYCRLMTNGRGHPAISDKTMKQIEQANVQFQNSTVTDLLIWKDCVEYTFKRKSLLRPSILVYPWPVLVERTKKIGEEIMGLITTSFEGQQPEKEDDDDNNNDNNSSAEDRNKNESLRRTKRLEHYINSLGKLPMCVPLLLESKIGKQISKVIKKCQQQQQRQRQQQEEDEEDEQSYFPDVWSEGFNGEPPLLVRLQELMSVWKDIASANGVEISSKSNKHKRNNIHNHNNNNHNPNNHNPTQERINQYSGINEKTSHKQHMKDIQNAQQCHQWRQLFSHLKERQQSSIKSQGHRISNIRKSIDTNRSKISQTLTKQKKPSKLRMMNGADNKLSLLREEHKYNVPGLKKNAVKKQLNSIKLKSLSSSSSSSSRNNAGVVKSGGFGDSVAFATNKPSAAAVATRKRTIANREVSLSNGKRMKLPNRHKGIPASRGPSRKW